MDADYIISNAKTDIDTLSRQAQLVILEGLMVYLYVTKQAMCQ